MPNENINQSTPSSKPEGIEPGSGEPTASSKPSEVERGADPAAPREGRERRKIKRGGGYVCLDENGRDLALEENRDSASENSGETVDESADVEPDDDEPEDDEPEEPAEDEEVKEISERKLKANRENAQKSTGPKTVMGKVLSRRNATKHGLFARQFMDFFAHGEDPQELGELLHGLRNDYQPVGRAEDLEVQRIALCWWKLKRVWRHENAVNRVALRDDTSREQELCQIKREHEKAVISMLQGATKEIEVTGEISQELKQKMFATMPGLEAMWPWIEEVGQELNIRSTSKMLRDSSAHERAADFALDTVAAGVNLIEMSAQWRRKSTVENTLAQRIIPNSEALDRILRYETATDRSLSRALDRLERLQTRRRRERIPDQVRTRLTQ